MTPKIIFLPIFLAWVTGFFLCGTVLPEHWSEVAKALSFMVLVCGWIIPILANYLTPQNN